MIKPQTLKGFRDFLPDEARKRQYVISTLKKVFESYGFEPLETPVLEYEEILAGKYGDEGDQLMYRFEDNGKRRVAMRYDQTVPLARVIAQYENQLTFPFKRYQIQPVWRAENTQKGRYREFIQCDIDIVGVNSVFSNTEIMDVAFTALKALGFKKFKLKVNDRKIFETLVEAINKVKRNPELINKLQTLDRLVSEVASSIDKLDKIGKEKVLEEIKSKPYLMENLIKGRDELLKISDFLNLEPSFSIKQTINFLKNYFKDEEISWLYSLESAAEELEKIGAILTPTLARGLNYYTGMIFEVEIEGYKGGAVVGGGRYDNLIGMFVEKKIPAVGCAFGFDRIIEAMDELELFPKNITQSSTQVLVTIFSKDLQEKSIAIVRQLRKSNINTEIYLGEIKDKNPLEKQLKYADAKKIQYVILCGPKEAEKNVVTLRNMQTREQTEGKLEDIISSLK